MQKKVAGPAIFAIFFLNEVNLKLILEFKKSFKKCHPVFPKKSFNSYKYQWQG